MESRSQPRIVLARLLMCVGFLLLCSTISTSIAKADDDLQQKSATLESLNQEALAHSPLIVAARRHWEAETHMPIQEGTLPDPEVGFQNLAVGNPIPGNNLQNSNFAYFGYGFSQEIPFPGKLRLRASLAEKEAESAHEEYQAEQCAIIEQVSESYFNPLIPLPSSFLICAASCRCVRCAFLRACTITSPKVLI